MSASPSISVIYSLSLPSGVSTYSATTLSAYLTTVIPTTSVYTTEGRILTTTTPIATVFSPGTTLIFPTPPEVKKKKSNLVVIIAASLGGFIGLVLIGVAFIVYKRRSRPRPRPVPPSPRASVHTFPAASIQHSSVTPYRGYHSPDTQPYHEPHLMTEVRNNQHEFVLAPPQPPSEKQRTRLLQRSQPQLSNQPGTMSRSSVDDTGSIASQPYTTSSAISSSLAGQGQPQYQQQPFTRPGHQHQRSRSTTSTTELMYPQDGRSTSPVATMGGGVAESPPARLGPTPSYFANSNMGAPGMQPLTEELEVGGPDELGYRPQQQNPRQSVAYTHPPPQPAHGQYQQYAAGGSSSAAAASSSQAGSSSGVGGASVTVDRGTGDRAELILAKNNTIRAQGRNQLDVSESMTNLGELPPTYESVQQSRMRRG